MFRAHSIRIATVAALGVLLVLWGDARAERELKAGAGEALEVQVLQAQVPSDQGERSEVLYRMKVLSVLRSSPSRVKPGDIIAVRADTPSEAPLAPGWIGVAYLKPDPKASGREARRQFIAAGGDSFKENPPGPPSATYTTPGDGGPGESPLLQGGVEVAGELTVRSD
jgi:hypothetical protein